MIRAWLIDSRGFVDIVKNNGLPSTYDCGANSQCPSCHYQINNNDVSLDWPGFPVGLKFDPSDVEFLEHLAAKCRMGDSEPHMFIEEFIPTLDGVEGICYTHPENLPGANKDGIVVHFFYKTVNAYASGKRKRRRIQDEEGMMKAHVRWHKTGKTKHIIENGVLKGCKKIMVLYTTPKKGSKPNKCGWIMHQYHLGADEDEKAGEYVVSKIFYQPNEKVTENKETSLVISESDIGIVQVNPRTPITYTPDPCREGKTSYSDCGSEDYFVHSLIQDVENLKEQFHPSCTSQFEYEMDYARCLCIESKVVGTSESDFLSSDTSASFTEFKPNNDYLVQVDSNAFFGIGDLDNFELDTPPDFQLSDLPFPSSQDSLFH